MDRDGAHGDVYRQAVGRREEICNFREVVRRESW